MIKYSLELGSVCEEGGCGLNTGRALCPRYGSTQAAGIDIYSPANISMRPYEKAVVHTGLYLEMPAGSFMMLAPRSGLGIRGMRLINTVGIIDSDYRGEIIAHIQNFSEDEMFIPKEKAFLQGVVISHQQYVLAMTGKDELSETERGEGGFGSTSK